MSVSALADSLVSHQALLQLEAGGLESVQGGGIDSAKANFDEKYTFGLKSVCLSLQGADCGEGVSRREMSCVVHWGSLSGPPRPVPVEDQWCVVNSQGKVSDIELQQPCTVPCPGLHLQHTFVYNRAIIPKITHFLFYSQQL